MTDEVNEMSAVSRGSHGKDAGSIDFANVTRNVVVLWRTDPRTLDICRVLTGCADEIDRLRRDNAILRKLVNHPETPDSSNDSEKPNSSSGRCSE